MSDLFIVSYTTHRILPTNNDQTKTMQDTRVAVIITILIMTQTL
jgi:hypothetical protein